MPARFLRKTETLCNYVLEPIRNYLQTPIIITSGYRCPELNKAVGGNPESQHMIGEAADIRCSRMDELIHVLKEFYIDYDQVIIYDTFIHISYSAHVLNRRKLIDKRSK